MASAGTRRFALVFSVALLALLSCMTNHDALEKKPSGAAGTVGAGGAAGSPSHVLASGSGGQLAGGGHPDDEAPGTSVLTIVHGVVDAPSVVVCFAKVASNGAVTPFGAPLSAAPLEYGQGLVLPAIPGADPAADVLEPFLIAGELELVSGLDCLAAIERARLEEAPESPSPSAAGAAGASDLAAAGSAGGAFVSAEGGEAGAAAEVQPRLRARGLPVIPAGTLNGGRSYLLVATGCLGGLGYGAANSEQYCGARYSEREPTVSAVFVALSRANGAGHVGMQVVHASLATGTIGVQSRSASPLGDSPISIVMNEVEGGLLPRPANLASTALDYGSTRGNRLEVDEQNAALLSESWADVLARGGIAPLEDGSTYALVLVGPRADSKNGAAFWNAPALTVVSADPK